MTRSIALSLLLAGCAAVRPLKPLASSSALDGVKVRYDDSAIGKNLAGDTRVDTLKLRTALTADLGRLGAQVGESGQLVVVLTSLEEGAFGSSSKASLDILSHGKLLQHLDYDGEQLCGPGGNDFNVSTPCFAREVANTLNALAEANPSLAQTDAPARAAQPSSKMRLRGKLAVLELRSHARELSPENVQYLTDVVRQAALRASTGADVITRENLLVLLQSTGRKLEDCEGECEVDTGRRIGADSVISGDLQHFGTQFKVSLRLHDTRDGKLLASSNGGGKSVDELEQSVQKAAAELFDR